MGNSIGVERQIPPRAQIVLELAFELMDLTTGTHRVELHVQDGRLQPSYITAKLPPAALGRFDRNQLEPELDRGELAE